MSQREAYSVMSLAIFGSYRSSKQLAGVKIILSRKGWNNARSFLSQSSSHIAAQIAAQYCFY